MTRPVRKRRPRRDWAPEHNGRRASTAYAPSQRLLMDPRRPPAPGPELTGEARERAVCASKQPYLSELLARNAAELILLAGRGPSWPYDCPWCPDWHLTSQPPA